MSIGRTPTGSWQARWRDDTGRQRARNFARRAEAKAFLDTTLTDLRRGTYVDPAAGAITVEAWARQWLEGAMNLGAGGRDTYQRDLDRHILPTLGALPLRRLTPATIDQLLAAQLADGLAPSTVHRHYRTIRRLAQVAVDRGKLPANPCDTVTPPRLHASEMRFLTAPQVEALAGAISPRYRTWIHTAVYAGLRWSELVGLRRARIDGDRILVAEQLIRRADRQWHREPPKTRAGTRTVTIPAFLAHDLAAHLERWSGPGPDGLVFPNRNGDPLVGSSFTGNVFKPALVRAGLDRDVRIHDLRHTAVALAIAAGAHPKAIQARMGHAGISVTLDRYGHLFPEMDTNLATALGAMHDTST